MAHSSLLSVLEIVGPLVLKFLDGQTIGELLQLGSKTRKVFEKINESFGLDNFWSQRLNDEFGLDYNTFHSEGYVTFYEDRERDGKITLNFGYITSLFDSRITSANQKMAALIGICDSLKLLGVNHAASQYGGAHVYGRTLLRVALAQKRLEESWRGNRFGLLRSQNIGSSLNFLEWRSQFMSRVESASSAFVDDRVLLACYAMDFFFSKQECDCDVRKRRKCTCDAAFGESFAYNITRKNFFLGFSTEEMLTNSDKEFISWEGGSQCVSLSTGRLFIKLKELSFYGKAMDEYYNDIVEWVDLFSKRVCEGVYCFQKSKLPLFPQKSLLGANYSVEVTNGVRVAGSSAHFFMRRSLPKWTYSIRLCIVPKHEPGYLTTHERGFETCQLVSRHWQIKIGSKPPIYADDFGVVGMFPVLGLSEDDEHSVHFVNETEGFPFPLSNDKFVDEFVFQSCCGELTSDCSGSLSGELEFIPGTIVEQTGRPFRVKVAPIVLSDHRTERFLY